MLSRLAKAIRPVLYKFGVHRLVRFMDRVVSWPMMNGLRKDYDFIMDEEPISGPSISHAERRCIHVNWLIDDVFEGSGGHTSIFRIMRHLEGKGGYKNRIYISGGSSFNSGESLKDFIDKNFFPLQAEVYLTDRSVHESDAVFATYWPTAYKVNRIVNTKKKFYLVQDYEAYFNPHSSNYELARNTYDLGLYGITLGSWLSDKLSREHGMKCTPINFSYDKDFYGPEGRVKADRQRVLFYSQPFKARRGFELGVITLNCLKKLLPDVEIIMVGGKFDSFKAPFEFTDKGVVSYSELSKVYKICDVALVLSFTNLSLLPLELMASKCAVVSNRGENVEWMLKDGYNCVLSDTSPSNLASAVYGLLKDRAERERIVENAYLYALGTNWDDELDKADLAIRKVLNG